MSSPEPQPRRDTDGTREPLSQRLRAHQLGAMVLGAVGLILGLLMVPRGDELLVMRVKGRNLPEAQRLLAEASALSSRASVVAHGDVHLQLGDVDAALSKLETYVRQAPDDVEAWQRLAVYYRQAQRMFDYVGALEQLQRLKPSAENARELAMRYLWLGDEQRELASLRTLVDAGQADEEEFVRAATLAASAGDLGTASAILHRLAQRAPQSFERGTIDLWAKVLIDLGRADAVQSMLGELPAVRGDATVLAGLGGLLRERGLERQAALLLGQIGSQGDGTTAQMARLQSALVGGDSAGAYASANELLLSGKLPPEGRLLLLESALAEGHLDEAWHVAELVGMATVPRWLRVKFVVSALDRGDRPGALAALVRVGDDCLQDNPLLAAELALAAEDVERAQHWIHEFDKLEQPTVSQVVQASVLERGIGRSEQAYVRLGQALPRALESPADVRQWALGAFIDSAREVSQMNDALNRLESVEWAATDEGRAAWLRVAGRVVPERAMAWLAIHPAPAPSVVEELYFARMEAGDYQQGLALARKLEGHVPTATHALYEGRARLAAGQLDEALPLLRLAAGEVGGQDLLHAALLQAHHQTGAHGDEIRRRLLPLLKETEGEHTRLEPMVEGLLAAGAEGDVFDYLPALARATPERWLAPFKDAAVRLDRVSDLQEFVFAELERGIPERSLLTIYGHVLIDTHAKDPRMLPILNELSREDPSWNFPYDELLEGLGVHAARIALWRREAHRATASAEDRRAAAFKLVALGAKPEAVEAFRALASSRSSDPVVGQLLFLWGPRPGPEALDWLADRLASAPPEDRAGWIGHLVNTGGSSRVLAQLPAWPVDESESVREAWLSAARVSNVPEAIAQGLQAELLTYPNARRARFVGLTALELGHPRLALDAWAVVVSQGKEDREAHRWLGTLAFYEGDLALAGPALDRYVSLGGAEPEPVYQWAEVLRAKGDHGTANRHYTRVVTLIEEMEAPSFFLSTLRANALSRLGEESQARVAFERLIARDPEADDVRADYAALLLEWGDLARAQDVLLIH